MTLFILFAGLGILIYTGVAHAQSSGASFSGAHFVFGLEFAFFVSLSVFLAVVMLFYARRVLREHSFSVDRVSTWRGRLFIVCFLFLACGVAVLVAASRVHEDSLSRAGDGGPGETAMTAEARLRRPSGSQAAVVGGRSERAHAAGMKLFQERGCVGCHRPDGTGVGPRLQGLFGRPVQEQSCGAEIVDEAYLREAILNPSATVAVGFPPVMPTFAARLTEEELQALIECLKSLRTPPQETR